MKVGAFHAPCPLNAWPLSVQEPWGQASLKYVPKQDGIRLYDAFPDGLERGMDRIDAFWEKGIARGKTTPEQRETWSANLDCGQ